MREFCEDVRTLEEADHNNYLLANICGEDNENNDLEPWKWSACRNGQNVGFDEDFSRRCDH
jgi:hypothetical protein